MRTELKIDPEHLKDLRRGSKGVPLMLYLDVPEHLYEQWETEWNHGRAFVVEAGWSAFILGSLHSELEAGEVIELRDAAASAVNHFATLGVGGQAFMHRFIDALMPDDITANRLMEKYLEEAQALEEPPA